MKFTEAQLESAIIELLGVEGYPHVLGEAIERQPQEVLIKADLRTFLAKQYAADHITPQEIEAMDRFPKPSRDQSSSIHRIQNVI